MALGFPVQFETFLDSGVLKPCISPWDHGLGPMQVDFCVSWNVTIGQRPEWLLVKTSFKKSASHSLFSGY